MKTKYLTLEEIYKKVGLAPEKDEADVVKDIYNLLMWTCTRCGYSWPKRAGVVPGTCASRGCNSPYWNKPRKEQ